MCGAWEWENVWEERHLLIVFATASIRQDVPERNEEREVTYTPPLKIEE